MDNIWSKMITALRGSAYEVGENLIEGQALRILDQEIRDADEVLRETKESLADLMTKQKLSRLEMEAVQNKVTEYEQYAIKALDVNNEDLAVEIATKIAAYEKELAGFHEHMKVQDAGVEKLRKAITQIEMQIKHMKQQADTVRATKSVQQAQIAVAQREGGTSNRLHSALESLERIKQKQRENEIRMEIKEELTKQENLEEQFEEKLKKAGIIPQDTSVENVLTRLKQKMES